MKVVYRESFAGDTKDFKTIIAKAKLAKADIYLVETYPPALDILTKELINAGVKNISTMGLFTTSPNLNLYNGLWYTDSTLTDQNLMDRFVKAYPGMRFNARTVPYGYDILNMLVQSFEKGGDAFTNMKAITEYDGKVGKVTKTPDSQNFRSSASIWTMVDGVPEMIR
jgi:ABC-type branched-subunit amino acid transport system substrate-binding protein